MANNDKLKQIVSNLQALTELTNSVMDLEIYPVSFFSQSFDLIQKIQNDIHAVEAAQVEMFSEQMKKHQALILSIHQQMRYISPEKDKQTQNQTPPVSVAKQETKDEPQMPATSKETIIHETNIPVQKEEKEKKVSFFSRIGLQKDSKRDENKMPSPVIEDPIIVPEKKTVIIKPVEEPAPPMASAPVQVNVVPAPPMAPATTPAPVQVNVVPAPTNAIIKAPQTHTESKTHQSLNDAIEKKKLSDLRKAFSLNDRFLYRRELFGGNEESMSKVIAVLNSKESLKDSISFLDEKLHWDFSNPTVKNFVKILELRFL